MSADGSTLYVCDTNNHSIKSVDMKTLHVETVEIQDPLSTTDNDAYLLTDISEMKVLVNTLGGDLTLKLVTYL